MNPLLKKFMMNLPEEDYHNYPAWSYSVVSKYSKEGFGSISTLFDRAEPTAAMEFGSLVDSIVTRGKKTLDYYAVLDLVVPDAEKKALDYIAQTTEGNFADLSQDVIYAKCIECGYQTRWKAPTMYEHLVPYMKYFDLKKSGKKIVSEKDFNDALDMARAIRRDEYLKNIFGTKNTKEKEFLYQVQFLINYTLPSGRTVPVKIMVDLMIIDHVAKTIQLVDLKTSSMPAWDFKENFIKFQYFLQASIYATVVDVIKSMIEELQDYRILPYLFTDISRVDKVPVTYSYDPFAEDQIDGFHFMSSGKEYKYKSWQTLIDEVLDYQEANAVVPKDIITDGPNDILTLLNK